MAGNIAMHISQRPLKLGRNQPVDREQCTEGGSKTGSYDRFKSSRGITGLYMRRAAENALLLLPGTVLPIRILLRWLPKITTSPPSPPKNHAPTPGRTSTRPQKPTDTPHPPPTPPPTRRKQRTSHYQISTFAETPQPSLATHGPSPIHSHPSLSQ